MGTQQWVDNNGFTTAGVWTTMGSQQGVCCQEWVLNSGWVDNSGFTTVGLTTVGSL